MSFSDRVDALIEAMGEWAAHMKAHNHWDALCPECYDYQRTVERLTAI